MCIIHSVVTCAQFLNEKQNEEFIEPILNRGLVDNIPNVKFYTIKLIETIWKYFDESSKNKLEEKIKVLINDEDIDVKYFANKFINKDIPK